MAILRKRQIENLEQMTNEELQRFLELLPAGQETVSELLDHIEDELYDKECNHSLQYAMKS